MFMKYNDLKDTKIIWKKTVRNQELKAEWH